MDSFIDSRKISSYSNALAKKLTTRFFSDHAYINGTQVKFFTDIEQINLFIIKNLFDKWQEETTKIRSPYFDYDATDVQQALKQLLNTLSNNIKVSKEFFRPLLEKAIENTLLLVIAPIQFFKNEILYAEFVTLDSIKQSEKFYKLNKSYINIIKTEIEKSGGTKANSKAILHSLFNSNLAIENNEIIFEKFSTLLQLRVNDFLISAPIKEDDLGYEKSYSEVDTVNIEAKHSMPESSSSIEEAEQINEAETNKLFENSSENIKEDRSISRNEDVQDLITKESAKKNGITLKDLIESSNAEYNFPVKEKIEDLRTAISISEKFIYIKELFGDDPSAFAVAISELEKSPSLNSAVELLENKYLGKYNWQLDNPYLVQFMELVERRFS